MAVILLLWVQGPSGVPPMLAWTGGGNSHLCAPDERCQHQSGKEPQRGTYVLTYWRSSELLELREKGLDAPLVPLLLWWSVVIAVSEAGVPTNVGVLDGSLVMDQH